MADLLTLTEYKSLVGIQAGVTQLDATYTALIKAASRAVIQFTGRNFEVATGLATPRIYQHDGSEILDVDDCTAIQSVSTDAGVSGQFYPLDATQWTAMPQGNSEAFYYLLLLGGPYLGASPEMGFQRNLDKYEFLSRPPTVTVTANWGWPEIPADVKLATALTISGLSSNGKRSEDTRSESIEGYSRSWGGPGTVSQAIPNRARDLLVAYQRVLV